MAKIDWPATWRLWFEMSELLHAQFNIPRVKAWQMARRLIGTRS